jgi:hypothetical protein
MNLDNNPILLDADDVSVTPIGPPACDQCGKAATHLVLLDMRANGCQTVVAECCRYCARRFAARLRRSLPARKTEVR